MTRFLARGCNLSSLLADIVSPKGYTLLHLAAKMNNIEMVDALLHYLSNNCAKTLVQSVDENNMHPVDLATDPHAIQLLNDFC